MALTNCQHKDHHELLRSIEKATNKVTVAPNLANRIFHQLKWHFSFLWQNYQHPFSFLGNFWTHVCYIWHDESQSLYFWYHQRLNWSDALYSKFSRSFLSQLFIYIDQCKNYFPKKIWYKLLNIKMISRNEANEKMNR